MYKMEMLLDKEYTVIVFLLSLASTQNLFQRFSLIPGLTRYNCELCAAANVNSSSY